MREKAAAGVVWHGAELAMQERRIADGYGSEIIYTFPGDKVAETERSVDTVIRVLTVQLGFPFSRDSLDKVKVLRDTHRVVSFYETQADFGSLNLYRDKDSQMVLMSPFRVAKALQDDMVAELSAEYIGRYL
jgi:hypothetical protein